MFKKKLSKLTVLILCGGKGQRLRPITSVIPKPLIKIQKKPILQYLLEHLNLNGIYDFIIATGYKSSKIRAFFNNKFKDSNIKFSDIGQNKDIIERVKKIINSADENLLICYGDTIADINIQKLYKFHLKKKSLFTLSSYELKTEFGVFDINKKDKLIKFKEKPKLNIWYNIGYMIINKKIYSQLNKYVNFENFLKNTIKKYNAQVYKHKGIHITINTLKELEDAKNRIKFFERNIKI